MLSDLLGGLALGDIGLSGVVILFVLAIMTGRLVPKSTLDNSNANGSKWQEAYMTQQQINSEHSASLSELLASSRATTHALIEIQAAGAYAISQKKSAEES